MVKTGRMLRSLGDRLQAGASVRQVYGEPIEFAGRMVIPVAGLRYGFGAGGGAGGKPGSDRSGNGSGGGAGISLRPLGALEITEAGTRFIRFVDPVPFGLALLIGFLVGLKTGRHARRR